MSFTVNAENADEKTCDVCGPVMPVSSGHVCAHILHHEAQIAKRIIAPGTPVPEFTKKEAGIV